MKHDPFFESACADILGCTSISTIMKEMRNWKYVNISTPVLFISNPEYACYLHFHMKVGGSMGDRDILLAYDYDPDFKPPNLTWKDLLEDAKIDCAGKSIEDTGEPGGGIFCAVCITYCEGGTRVEDGDLTTHLRSETREIEVSIILLTSSYLVFCITNQSLLVNRCLGSFLRLYLTAS
ncbi:uncharacterized protein LOC125589209 [Brassica napus]|uniref:uncharacterized protein LOC125589209 n=1 Tax=Brassica napus TaxID=3708 RepID=UPI00207A6696|nr:uncharacterized protein LOC125589209 [Brassica napus]